MEGNRSIKRRMDGEDGGQKDEWRQKDERKDVRMWGRTKGQERTGGWEEGQRTELGVQDVKKKGSIFNRTPPPPLSLLSLSLTAPYLPLPPSCHTDAPSSSSASRPPSLCVEAVICEVQDVSAAASSPTLDYFCFETNWRRKQRQKNHRNDRRSAVGRTIRPQHQHLHHRPPPPPPPPPLPLPFISLHPQHHLDLHPCSGGHWDPHPLPPPASLQLTDGLCWFLKINSMKKNKQKKKPIKAAPPWRSQVLLLSFTPLSGSFHIFVFF